MLTFFSSQGSTAPQHWWASVSAALSWLPLATVPEIWPVCAVREGTPPAAAVHAHCTGQPSRLFSGFFALAWPSNNRIRAIIAPLCVLLFVCSNSQDTQSETFANFGWQQKFAGGSLLFWKQEASDYFFFLLLTLDRRLFWSELVSQLVFLLLKLVLIIFDTLGSGRL